jgi:hypothetical protein
VILLGGIAQVVQHGSGLHASQLVDRVDVQDSAQVLGAVDDNRDVAALASQARPAATW